MQVQKVERTVRLVMARFEFIWGRTVTPMEFYQLVELIATSDERMDMDMLVAHVIDGMESLEDSGQDCWSVQEFSEQLYEVYDTSR